MPNSTPRFVWLVLAVAWLAPLLALTGPVLLTDRTFGFRDATHYYLPLAHVVRNQWREGVPLWNSHEERGRPLLADPTACVLYPGQLLFALPIPLHCAFELYVVAHVLLCCLTMYHAGRRLGLGTPASALSSISYAFGGSIVFQTCNPPYLISAAWLPYGIVCVLDTVAGRRWKPRIELAAVLTLMVLGGDPQSAYLLGVAGLVAVGLATWTRRRECRPFIRTIAIPATARLAGAGLLAIAISAVQWIPTLTWAVPSERFSTGATDNSSNSSPAATDSSVSSLAAIVPLSDHPQSRYQFSIGPWRWTELFWPNVAGKPFPINARWITAVRAEGRFWSPSLYMGLLPIAFALSGLRFFRGTLAERWFSWIIVGGVLGSLGVHGLGWLAAEIDRLAPFTNRSWSNPTGGLYWAMSMTLPGFRLFRYPAKLWTWTAAAASLLAAQELERRIGERGTIVRERRTLAYIVLSVVLVLIALVTKQWLMAWFHQAAPDSLFGPLNIALSFRLLIIGLLQGTLLAITWLGVSRLAVPQWKQAWIAVLLTTIDLTVAHPWLLPTVSESAFARDSFRLARVADNSSSVTRTLRWSAAGWYPRSWSTTGSVDRLEECVRWDRITFRPKYPLLVDADNMRSSTSFSLREHLALLRVLDDCREHAPTDYLGLLSILGVRYVATPESVEFNGPDVAEHSGLGGFPSDANFWQVMHPWPRAWVVHQGFRRSPQIRQNDRQLLRSVRDGLFVDGRLRPLAHEVLLESVDELPGRLAVQDVDLPMPVQPSPCRVAVDRGHRLEIEVALDRSGWLVVNDTFASGWRAYRSAAGRRERLAIYRANGVMRAVALPAGRHLVVFEYMPISVYVGATISCLSLVVVIVATVTIARRKPPFVA